MNTTEIFKIGFFILISIVLLFGGINFWKYNELKVLLENTKTESVDFLFGHSIDSHYLKFGEFPFTDNDDFNGFVNKLKQDYWPNKKFEFEKYPYKIKLDTMTGSYTFYSSGPDMSFDGFDFLPINDETKAAWDFNPAKFTFFDYIVMDKNFDIVFIERKLDYNCNKNINDVPAIKIESDNEKILIAESFFDNIEKINKSEKLLKLLKLNRINIKDTPLIFRIKKNKIDCICNQNISPNKIEIIKQFLIKEIDKKYKEIEVVTFYITPLPL